MVKITINGYGTFEIPENRVSALITWLSTNNGVSIMEKNVVREVVNDRYTGRTLLND
jgi:hypothetical protein